MSHVFHPNHDALHGRTVVLSTAGPRTYVGRWHDVADGVVRLHDAAVHEEGRDELGRDEWLRRTRKYGIEVQERTMHVPHADVRDVVLLGDLKL